MKGIGAREDGRRKSPVAADRQKSIRQRGGRWPAPRPVTDAPRIFNAPPRPHFSAPVAGEMPAFWAEARVAIGRRFGLSQSAKLLFCRSKVTANQG
jgi:hypothetical protein